MSLMEAGNRVPTLRTLLPVVEAGGPSSSSASVLRALR
jgi:hypothetical protein